VARLSGVSVRALHHYDQIGLLKPAFTGENRYRYYGHEELLRLQQILIHRELGIPLSDIAGMIDAPGFDRLEALRAQRQRLQAEAKRFARLVRTIDRTIASLKGDRAMKDADLYKGISPAKQAEYEAWLIDRLGGDTSQHIADGHKVYGQMSAAEQKAKLDALKVIEEGVLQGMRMGVPPQALSLDPVLQRHRDWVAAAWDRPCAPDAYAGLADLYLSHPDFIGRFESMEQGFAEYLTTAMKAWARRQGQS
jgi:DNA-binding transcriptional MerR regulator